MPKKVMYDIEEIARLESDPERLSLREIAKRLGKDQSTLVRWLNSNCVKAVSYKLK